MTTWNVTLHKQGARLDVSVEARNQTEARRFGEAKAPGYKATNAQRA